MAARNRPRAGQLKDEIDEERSLWNQIKADGRRFDQLMVCSGQLPGNRDSLRKSTEVIRTVL